METDDIRDVLPVPTPKNEKGEDVQTADLTAESGVVIFLADTRKFLLFG